MEECSNCGTVLSGAEESCVGCGKSLVETGDAESDARLETDSVSRSKTNLFSNLVAAGRHAIPFGRNPDVDGRFMSQRVEDGVRDYAMFLPLTRGYISIALGVVGLLLGGVATFVVGDILAGMGIVSSSEALHGSTPMPWWPRSILASIAIPLAAGSTEAAIGAAVRAGCLLAGLIPSFGYTFQLIEAGARGETHRPLVTDYPGLLADGVRAYGVFIVAILGAQTLSVALSQAATMTYSPLHLLGLVVVAVTYYLLPAVLVIYAASGSLLTALSPGVVFDFAGRSRYAGAYLEFVLTAAVIFFCLVVAGFALGFTIVGLVIAVPLLFTASIYVQYFGGTFWGATYHNAAADGEVRPAEQLAN